MNPPGESGDSTGSRASRRDVPASDATLILGLLHGCRHFQTAVELIGKRWSSAILLALARGATRFGEIRTLVPGLSDRMLAERMRELQAAKLVERDVVPTTPVQIRYHLTERGTDLIKSLHPLVKWGHPGKGRGMPTLTAIPPLKRRPGVFVTTVTAPDDRMVMLIVLLCSQCRPE